MSNITSANALTKFHESDTAEARLQVLEALSQSELIFAASESAPVDLRVVLAFAHDERGRPLVPGNP